eukprot:354306-Chlamydomonas_euryale.AAC.7
MLQTRLMATLHGSVSHRRWSEACESERLRLRFLSTPKIHGTNAMRFNHPVKLRTSQHLKVLQIARALQPGRRAASGMVSNTGMCPLSPHGVGARMCPRSRRQNVPMEWAPDCAYGVGARMCLYGIDGETLHTTCMHASTALGEGKAPCLRRNTS